jgi:hypothetical protein
MNDLVGVLEIFFFQHGYWQKNLFLNNTINNITNYKLY